MVKPYTLILGIAAALFATTACSDDNGGGGGGRDDAGGGAPGDLDASRLDAAEAAVGGSGLRDGGPPIAADGSPGSSDSGFESTDGGIPDSGQTVCDTGAKPAIPALRLEVVAGAESINRLVDAEQPKGTADWYLVQQSGTVRVLRNGALLAGNFVDVTSEVTVSADGDERGLLGIAFPPDFTSTGKFYVAVTPTKGADANRDSVYEYQRSPDGLSSTRTKQIVKLDSSDSNHNGGNLQFGPDGFLYFGTGDGGGGCNSNMPGVPQSTGSQFGKILRFDPNAVAPFAAAGNPFSGSTGDPTVSHYGFRNPFRFGFDRATGDLYVGDVGQDAFEEIDYAPAGSTGLNFGWPVYEGDHPAPCNMSPKVPLNPGSVYSKPIVDLPQNTGLWGDYVSAIGGLVYRGTAIPALRGVYLFGDYQGERMGALYQCGSQTSPVTPIGKNKDPNQPAQAGFTPPPGAARFGFLTAIVDDNAGEIYFVVNRNTLWKVVAGG